MHYTLVFNLITVLVMCSVNIFFLRSSKTADKRIFLFTNEDDPFGSMRISVKEDMTRTTLQRAKVVYFQPSVLTYLSKRELLVNHIEG